jgi:hypothetical protein
LKSIGGDMGFFGLGDLRQGRSMQGRVSFLEGMLPLATEKMALPHVSMRGEFYTDVHLIRENEDCWVVLLDVTKETTELQLLRQRGNELSLAETKLARCLRELESGRVEIKALRKELEAERHGG